MQQQGQQTEENKASNVIRVIIPEQDMGLIIANAKKARIGGSSNIRCSEARQRNLSIDQIVGQMCNYAAIQYLTDSAEGYMQIRKIANQHPFRGDQGRDIPFFPVDVKGSLIRGGRSTLDHRLLIRPRERHDNWIYVLALVESLEPPIVLLMGWAKDLDLREPESEGVFRGAHAIWADELRDLSILKKAVQITCEKRRLTNEMELDS